MKQMEVTILGQSYLLGCPDGGEVELLEAVGNVDREMSAIRDGGKVKARERKSKWFSPEAAQELRTMLESLRTCVENAVGDTTE